MKQRVFTARRSLLALLLAASGGSSAAEQPTGLRADGTIPDAIFEQPQTAKPWLQRQPQKKAVPPPATAQNVEQQQALTRLQNELKQQQTDNAALKTKSAEQEQTLNRLTAELAALKAAMNPTAVKLDSHQQKLAYANGVAFANNIVQSLQKQSSLGIETQRAMVLAGINDAFSRKSQLNVDEVNTLLDELDQTLSSKLLAEQDKAREERERQRKAGEKYIAEMKKAKGVKALDGALYKVVKAGKGPTLKAENAIEMLLTGRLPDGKVFDNSGNENIPQQVKIDSLLPAVTNVLTQVTAGSEIEIILPPELAFGEEGIENFIPGNATVIFNIKISKVIAN